MQISPSPTAFGFSGPLYAQVAAYLRDKISTSVWTPAAPLPNEASLAKDIGVSIGTVRKALELLEDERLIRRRQGRGTFVIDASEHAANGRFSSVTQDGRRLRSEVTAFAAAIDVPPPEGALALQLAPGSRAVIVDLDWRAGHVRARERLVVSQSRFPGLEQTPAPTTPTLFHVYRRDYHVVVHKVAERIKSVAADEALSQALGALPGQPILQVSRIASTVAGEAVEWSLRSMVLGSAAYEATLG